MGFELIQTECKGISRYDLDRGIVGGTVICHMSNVYSSPLGLRSSLPQSAKHNLVVYHSSLLPRLASRWIGVPHQEASLVEAALLLQ